jgi:hypothetical protein
MRTNYHIVIDGPWGTESDNAARSHADSIYDMWKGSGVHDRIRLVKSHHKYSEGYWVEADWPESENEVNPPDFILRIYFATSKL